METSWKALDSVFKFFRGSELESPKHDKRDEASMQRDSQEDNRGETDRQQEGNDETLDDAKQLEDKRETGEGSDPQGASAVGNDSSKQETQDNNSKAVADNIQGDNSTPKSQEDNNDNSNIQEDDDMQEAQEDSNKLEDGHKDNQESHHEDGDVTIIANCTQKRGQT